jgi:hypothetical protein
MKKSLIYLAIALPGAVVLAQSAPSGPPAKSASPTTQPSSNNKTASKSAPAKVIADDFGGGGGGDTSAGSGAPRGGGDDFGGGGPSNGSDFGGGGFPGGGDNGGGFQGGFGGRRGRGGFGGFGGFGGPGGGSATFEPKLENKYAILETRSIFARDRRVANTSVAGRGEASESTLAFRGAAVEDGKFVAFIEDTNRQATQTVHVNDRVGQGRCTAITLDSITYEVNGEPRDIELGYSLAGTPAPAPVAAVGGPNTPGNVAGDNPFGNWSRNRNFLPGGANIPNLTQEQIDQIRQMRDQRRQRGGGGRRSRDSSQ